MEREIRGCIRCGSSDLSTTPKGANPVGVAVAVMSTEGDFFCNRCGYYWKPLIFKSEKARKAYEKAKKEK